MEIGQRKFIEDVCNSFNTPVAILDGDLTCLYCNREGFLEQGKRLASVMLTEIKKPVTKESKAMVSINGMNYSIRVMPFCGDLIFCEFFDLQEVYSLAEFTDLYDKVIPYTHSMNQNIANLWKNSNDLENYLRQKGDFDSFERIYRFKNSLNALNSDIYNISNIVALLFEKQSPTPVHVHVLLKNMIDRCNSLLANCGRAIEYQSDAEEYFILSTESHAMIALINALQNALLYSPGDSNPLVLLSSVLEKQTRYVVLKVVNDGIYFVDEKIGDKIDRNFNFQRSGLGIPIIKRFVEECGGLYSMEEQNNKVILEIKIPQYIPSQSEFLLLESPGTSYYKTGIPDLIEIKMNDVINFFRNKNG